MVQRTGALVTALFAQHHLDGRILRTYEARRKSSFLQVRVLPHDGRYNSALKPTKQLPHLRTFVRVAARMPLGTADLIAIFKTWNNAQDIRNETHMPVGGAPDKRWSRRD